MSVQSCFNYTGGKYRLLSQISPLFPNEYDTFVDLFCGSGVVGVNANPKKSVLLNDLESEVIDWYHVLLNNPLSTILNKLYQIIEEFGLSNTSQFSYDYYGADSSSGLTKVNKEAYLRLRKAYNQMPLRSDVKSYYFYLLTAFSFNNQIRFNRNKEFNLPVGKRDFNSNLQKKLVSFYEQMHNKKIMLSSLDFEEVSIESVHDFVYVDPPYLISTASYNENGGWTEKDEMRLLDYLANLNKQNVRFALSNVLLHRGRENEILKEWSKAYNVHHLNYNYNNSNYQIRDKQAKTIEVLITNY